MCPRSTPVMCLQCSSAAEMPLLLRRVIEQGRFIFLLFDAPGSMVLLCQVSKKPVKPRAFIHEQQDKRDWSRKGKLCHRKGSFQIRQKLSGGRQLHWENLSLSGRAFYCRNRRVSIPEENKQMASESKNLVNDIYAKDFSKKAKLHLKQRREEGSYVGDPPPHGYQAQWNEKKHVLAPDENT